MKRVTITLPEEQLEAIKGITDNVSGYVSSAVERYLRGVLLDEHIRQYEEEFGAFTEEEMAEAEAFIDAAMRGEIPSLHPEADESAKPGSAA